MALSRRQDEWGFACLTAVTILCCLLPLSGAGWPFNHSRLSFVIRTAIYADHMRQGDLLPIWASSTSFGLGTPLPLFYHKTFFWVSGAIFLASQAAKASIVASVALFMVVGAYGVRAAVRTFTMRTAVAWCAPQALLLARYTFTDWLVRGAVAEFAAMMLLPWLLWWCLELLANRRMSWAIVPVFVLLFHAHNVIAYCALCPVAIAAALVFAARRGAAMRELWRRSLLIAAAVAVLLAPHLAVMQLFLRDYDVSKITQAGYLATQNFLSPIRYVYDPDYTWLKDWTAFTVAIDPSISLALACGALVFAVRLFRKPAAVVLWARRELTAPAPLFLFSSLLVFTLLLCRFAAPVYWHVPGLQYLQFPWRLMTFVTPLGILATAFVASRFEVLGTGRSGALVAGLWLAGFVAGSPLLHAFQHPFFTTADLVDVVAVRPGGIGRLMSGIGEYLPRVSRDGKELETTAVLGVYLGLSSQNESTVRQGPCDVAPLPRPSFDALVVSYRVECAGPAALALPVSYNRYSDVVDVGGGGGRLAYFRRKEDPRMWVAITGATRTVLEVRLPTAARVAARLWSR
jgi:hypothetical protein